MLKFRAQTTIQASADTIWGILTDASRYPEWDPNMERLEGTIALGQKITAHTKVSDRAFPVTVSVFTPGQEMVWSSGMPLGLFKGERTFSLRTINEQNTEVTVEEIFTGLLLPLIGRTIPNLQPTFDQFVAGLKRRAERA